MLVGGGGGSGSGGKYDGNGMNPQSDGGTADDSSMAVINGENKEEIAYDTRSIADICQNLNKRYKNAKDAGRESTKCTI